MVPKQGIHTGGRGVISHNLIGVVKNRLKKVPKHKGHHFLISCSSNDVVVKKIAENSQRELLIISRDQIPPKVP